MAVFSGQARYLCHPKPARALASPAYP